MTRVQEKNQQTITKQTLFSIFQHFSRDKFEAVPIGARDQYALGEVVQSLWCYLKTENGESTRMPNVVTQKFSEIWRPSAISVT